MIIDNCKVRLRVQIEKSEMRLIRGWIDKSEVRWQGRSSMHRQSRVSRVKSHPSGISQVYWSRV